MLSFHIVFQQKWLIKISITFPVQQFVKGWHQWWSTPHMIKTNFFSFFFFYDKDHSSSSLICRFVFTTGKWKNVNFFLEPYMVNDQENSQHKKLLKYFERTSFCKLDKTINKTKVIFHACRDRWKWHVSKEARRRASPYSLVAGTSFQEAVALSCRFASLCVTAVVTKLPAVWLEACEHLNRHRFLSARRWSCHGDRRLLCSLSFSYWEEQVAWHSLASPVLSAQQGRRSACCGTDLPMDWRSWVGPYAADGRACCSRWPRCHRRWWHCAGRT